MRTVHYRNDFDFILRLRDCLGNDIGFPPSDWCARFWTTSRAGYFEVSSINGVLTNCFNDAGRIHVVANNHNLKPGVLMCEFQTALPDNRYPDGSQHVITPDTVDIELVCGKGYISDAEAVLALPLVKGEPFTYTDFTPEQIAELKQPAVAAAKELKRFVNAAEEAERTRVAHETTREEQETARKDAEAERVKAETLRVSAEDGRKEAETLRVSAEEKREVAEQKRATEFAGFKEAIDAKPNFADLSNVFGEPTSVESDDKFEARTGFTREDIKKDLFDDMFKAAAGSYGTVDHAHVENNIKKPYYLNELWLTYEEAQSIMAHKADVDNLMSVFQSCSSDRTCLFENYGAGIGHTTVSINRAFLYCFKMEIIRLPNMAVSNTEYAFYDCRALREIIGAIDIAGGHIPQSMFKACHNLEEVRLGRVGGNSSFVDCPKISSESLAYIVVNRSGTAAFTITVHPDVYAKLIDETNTEWHQLLLDAAGKQIQFATA